METQWKITEKKPQSMPKITGTLLKSNCEFNGNEQKVIGKTEKSVESTWNVTQKQLPSKGQQCRKLLEKIPKVYRN